MLRTRPFLAAALAAALAASAAVSLTGAPTTAAPRAPQTTLVPIGTYRTGVFDGSAAEISAHDPTTQRLFVVNFAGQQIDIVDIADPVSPQLVTSVELGGSPNSVDVHDGLVAVAVEGPTRLDPGEVVFMDADGVEVDRVVVGALPDMLTFTPDGSKVVVANEGEPFAGLEGDGPSYSGDADPEGSISVIDVAALQVETATFGAFEGQREALVAAGVRINPAVPTLAQDLEPEYVTVSADSSTAWVSLQENNAIAEVDLASATVTSIVPLGRKDHSIPGNGLDPSDRDPEGAPTFDIRTFDNLYGIHMPDAIANVEVGGVTYLLTANEGDAREYTGLTDVSRVRDLRDITNSGTGSRANALCAEEFPDRAALVEVDQLGRLNVSTIDGFDPVRNCYSELHALGARSFSIFTTDGTLVFDSGEDFERITQARSPEFFNSNHRENSLETRSDDKGPEPEAITVTELFGTTYAMVGLERIGGVMTYDISDPTAPTFVDYTNNRDFTVDPTADLDGAGDLGAEDITVIRPSDSPNGRALVVVANEVSGTTTLFEVVRSAPVPPACASAAARGSNGNGPKAPPPPCNGPWPPGRR